MLQWEELTPEEFRLVKPFIEAKYSASQDSLRQYIDPSEIKISMGRKHQILSDLEKLQRKSWPKPSLFITLIFIHARANFHSL